MVERELRARRVRDLMFWVAAVAWLLAPVVVVGLLYQHLASRELVPKREVWAAAEPGRDVHSEAVGLALKWSEGRDIVAPAWSGIITQVAVEAGSTLASGEPVLDIDGITRIAAHMAVPLHRPLDLGARGDDVRSLLEFLRSIGATESEGEFMSWQAWMDVRDFVGTLGGVADDEIVVFDPGLLVYISDREVRIDEVQVSAGEPAPSAGSALMSVRGELESAVLVDPDVVAHVSAEDPTVVEKAQSSGMAIPEDAMLQVGREELALVETRDAVLETDLQRLAGVVAYRAPGVTGRASVPQPSGMSVPAAAVLASMEGQCLIIRREGSRVSVPVETVQSTDGSSVVAGDVAAGDEVLVNPVEMGLTCS